MAGSRLAALAVLIATGCGGGETPVRTSTAAAPRSELLDDRQAARRTLLAADRIQAEANADAGFADGFTAHLADSAVYLPPDHDPVRGAMAIGDLLAATLPAVTSFDRTVARAGVAASGDVGYTFGWTVTTEAGTAVYGKYLAGWTRDAAGAWRVAAYLPNASPGPPGNVPAWLREGAGDSVRPGDPGDPLTSLLDADRAFADLAVAAGTAEAFGRYAAPEGVALADGGGMVFGRDAIRDAYTFPPGWALRWTPLGGIAARTGDLGFTWGTWELDVPTADGVTTRYGKYLSLWEKDGTGAWRFVADGGNPGPPPHP